MDKGNVLVAKAKGASNTFLPGGHIEFGEKAEDALVREIGEELGRDAVVKNFRGAVEHTWTEEQVNFEINLVFEVEIPDLSSDVFPVSQEGYLDFFWLHPDKLEGHNLQPSPLIDFIQNIDSFGRAFWGTTW